MMFDLTQPSKREKQILDLLAQGYGTSEVGKRLFLSVKTVSTYRFRIRDKFGITHGTQWMALLRQIPLRDDLAASVTFGSFAKELLDMIAGIIIDNWKLPIYHKHLDAAGYKYEKSVPFSTNTSILRVHYEKKEELSSIIQAAQLECDKKLS